MLPLSSDTTDGRSGVAGRVSLLACLMALLLMLPLAAWLARLVLRPVRALAEHAERVAAGPDEPFAATTRPSPIREFERLRAAIGSADQAMQERFESERRAAAALATSELRYRTLAETGALVMWRCDAQGELVAAVGWDEAIQRDGVVAPGTAPDSGALNDPLLARNWFLRVHAEDRQSLQTAWGQSRSLGRLLDAEFRILTVGETMRWVRARGAPVRDVTGTIVEWVGVLEDVDERRKAEGRVAHLAHHDVRTGLPNRALLSQKIERSIADAARSGHSFSVIFVDVDQFKTVNDSLGHPAGDEMLCEVGRRIAAVIAPRDDLARISGDESSGWRRSCAGLIRSVD